MLLKEKIINMPEYIAKYRGEPRRNQGYDRDGTLRRDTNDDVSPPVTLRRTFLSRMCDAVETALKKAPRRKDLDIQLIGIARLVPIEI